MVEGPNDVYICAECVRIAHQIVETHPDHAPAPNVTDESGRRSGHLEIRCYFTLKRDGTDQWRAVADFPSGFVGYGRSPKDAVRDLQVKVLSATAASFANSPAAGDHLINHAAEAFT